MSPYGYCPVCGAEGVRRERRINGNDTCKNGHIYPSKDSLREPKFQLSFTNEVDLIKWLQDNISINLEYGVTGVWGSIYYNGYKIGNDYIANEY